MLPLRPLMLFVLVVTVGCSGPAGAPGDDAGGGSAQIDGAPPGSGADAAGFPTTYLCHTDPPPGTPDPPMPPPYAGACPVIADGPVALTSSGATRAFIAVLPADAHEGERLPVAFLWHPLGSTAEVFLERGELRAAIDEQRFVAILPQSKDDVDLKWPITLLDSEARVQEELRFFDDMLACVVDQLPVNRHCVLSGGVSSGGLWTSQLASRRAQVLSSFMSLSGGTGGSFIKPWQTAARRLPAFVLWGGEADNCFGLFSFVDTSRDLEQHLTADGHFLIECIHNCGHAIPPFDPAPGTSAFAPLWDFGLNHPYWLGPGQSPYMDTGLPPLYPGWCAIGAGNATPRTGECVEPSQC